MTLTRAIPLNALTGVKIGIALLAFAIGASHYLRVADQPTEPEIETATVVLQNGRTLIVQKREVTVAQWQSCHTAGHCTLDLSAHEKDTDYPATGLSYIDATEYMEWLNTYSDRAWRLPSAAEWRELAADVMPEKPDPIFTDPSMSWASAYLIDANRTGRALRESGAFTATAAGIEDLDGNVWEWTQDCYAGSSGQNAETDNDRCPAFVMGGEHEAVMSYLVRDPARGGCAIGVPPAHLGMRLVSDAS